MENNRPFLADGISAIAIHNGVARVQFMRLSLDGKAVPSVEIDLPVNAIKLVVDALKKVTPH